MIDQAVRAHARAIAALQPVDWFRVLADLRRSGLSLSQVSAATDIPERTLVGWHRGETMPRHHSGDRLLALWCERLEKGRDSAPRVRRYSR